MLPCPPPRPARAMTMSKAGRRQLATIGPSMQSPDFVPAERQAIHSALSRIERRLRLNRIVQTTALCGGVVLLALITWRALIWLGETLPAAFGLGRSDCPHCRHCPDVAACSRTAAQQAGRRARCQ